MKLFVFRNMGLPNVCRYLDQPGGADYAHHFHTGTPVFSDLPTSMYLDLVELETRYLFSKEVIFICSA